MSKQGQGGWTLWKELGFGALFAQSLAISKRGRAMEFPYWHIDLNAGSGWNERASCDGSPVVFARAAQRAERSCRARFVELREDACVALSQRLSGMGLPLRLSWQVRHGDNREALAEFGEEIARVERPAFAVGTLLCDPNGWNDCPYEAIQQFSRRFPRIDIILHINLRLFLRFDGCKKNESFARWFRKFPEPSDILSPLCRPCWFVRPPRVKTQGDYFLTAFGTSLLERRPAKQFGFVPLEAWDAQEALQTMKPAGQLEFPFLNAWRKP